jgi:hypothetical protein
MDQTPFSTPVTPIPGNMDLTTATKPPVIEQPINSANSVPSPMFRPANDSAPVVKVAMGLIPLFVFVVTGIVSFSLINGNKNKTLQYQSKASEPVGYSSKKAKTGYAALLPEATNSGCIFSLRYDAASASATLKDNAKNAMLVIKSKLEKGEVGKDVLFEILNGQTKTDIETLNKELFTNPSSYQAKLKAMNNPYSAFQPGDSSNFCYTNTKEVNEKLTVYFYNLNPDFQTNFKNTTILRVSEPFQVYKSTQSGKTDYGWMIISK